jgi:DNA-binding Lrp family transcriptional regulator
LIVHAKQSTKEIIPKGADPSAKIHFDFLLKIVVADSQDYNELLRTNISTLSYVKKLTSFPALSEIKRETGYELQDCMLVDPIL